MPGQQQGRAIRLPRVRRGVDDGMSARRRVQHGKSGAVMARDHQRDAREGQARPHRMAERPVVPAKPVNAGGGKGPWFKVNAE